MDSTLSLVLHLPSQLLSPLPFLFPSSSLSVCQSNTNKTNSLGPKVLWDLVTARDLSCEHTWDGSHTDCDSILCLFRDQIKQIKSKMLETVKQYQTKLLTDTDTDTEEAQDSANSALVSPVGALAVAVRGKSGRHRTGAGAGTGTAGAVSSFNAC